MKILVAIIAILVFVSAEDEYDEYDEEDYDYDEDYGSTTDTFPPPKVNWTGNVKTLVDTAQLEPEIILNISRNIFQNMTKICNGTMGMPNATFLASPTAECDLTLMGDLSAAVLDPRSFNSEKFLREFWSSLAGRRLLKEIEGRGVSEDVIKAAMKETWFNKTSYRDTAFNRLFLGTDRFGTEDTKAYNSWYTFDIDNQRRSNCNFTVEGEELPVVVAGWCEGQTNSSHFIYPNHPYVDLTLYTLCAWDKDPEMYRSKECLVVVPGSENRFRIVQEVYIDDHDITYLSDVKPVYIVGK